MRPTAWLAVVVVGAIFLSGCTFSGSDRDDASKDPNMGAAASVFPGDYDFRGPFSRVLTPGPYDILSMRHVFLSGEPHLGEPADIEIGIWMPDVPEDVRVPVIADIGPYFGDTLLRGEVPNGVTPGYVENFVPHGYAFAAVSVRGSGQSGGCMDYMAALEQRDIDRAITWLGTQDWGNGNVGLIGKSYDGATPWTAAATGNPHLKTIVPIVGIPSIMDASLRYGHSGLLTYLGGGNHHLYWSQFLVPDDGGPKPERAFCPEIWEGVVDGQAAVMTGQQSVTGWYEARHAKPDVAENYRGSILVAHGLHDHSAHVTIPWVGSLNESGIPVKQLYYQGAHVHPDQVYQPSEPYMGADPLGRWARWDWSEVLLHWFDRWLKDDPSVDVGPAVQVQDDKLQWRNEESYPPRDITHQEWFPTAGGGLEHDPGDAFSAPLLPGNTWCEIRPCHEPSVSTCAPHLMDPSEVSGLAVDFYSEPLDEALRIAGVPKFYTSVTAGGPTGMLGVWLFDVDEAGAEKRIGWGSVNLWYAKNPQAPEPLVPGETFDVELDFLPLDAHVPAGHSIHVRVWQCEAALFYQVQPGSPVVVEFGEGTDTRLELPTIERGPSAYFEPPMPKE